MSSAAGSRYDAHASWYHDWVFAPDDDLVARSLLALVGPVTGQRVLDLACGEGRIARLLAGRGNAVVGVDLSAGLLAIARAAAGPDVRYLHADVCTTGWWDGTPFDGAVSSMALMDIDDLDGAVATAAATVRPGGWFAWSIIHPGFPGVGASARAGRTAATSRRAGGTPAARACAAGSASNHRTLATYLNTLATHGFVFEAADEPPWTPGPDEPPLPFFLVTRWRRDR